MAQSSSAEIHSILDIANFIDGFLAGAGTWVQDKVPTGSATDGDAAWHVGDLYVQMAWDALEESNAGPGTHFDLYQSTSYDGNGELDDEPGWSGHKIVTKFGTGSGSSWISIAAAEIWGTTNANVPGVAANDIYAYFTLEYNRDGRFVHFGFGHLEHYNSFVGGAFSYAGQQPTTVGGLTGPSAPWDAYYSILLDSNHQRYQQTTFSNSTSAVMRLTGATNQPADSKWGTFTRSTSNYSNDTDGEEVVRLRGWSRQGPWPHTFLHLRGNPANSFIPIIPVEVAYNLKDTTDYQMLGKMRNVGVCNIGNIQPKEVLTLSSGQDYQFFPWAQKLTNQGDNVIATRNGGIAYLQV